MADELIIPPIQQSLEDVGSAQSNGIDPPLTEKSWYLYWQRTGRLVNQHSRMITYGTHAGRPETGMMPGGALYMETDRGDVIYQNVDGAWQYVAGTMWGTLTPDQRPTDLGVYDGGFHFRGTDKAREFLWSQSAWIEVTPIYYGTHAARPAVATMALGVAYVETDRSNVIYENQGGVWHYIGGILFGTISPDQRPADLGAGDTGFLFQATDTHSLYRWSGSAWVLETAPPQANTAQYAYSSTFLTLTTSPQAVPGCAINITKAGTYLVAGTFYFYLNSGDVNYQLIGNLNPAQPTSAILAVTGVAGIGMNITLSQSWIVTISSVPGTINLTGYKGGGTGTSKIGTTHTSISAIWISP